MEEKSILLYSDNNPRASRNVWVSIEEGNKLHVLQHDVGPLVEEMMCADDDYERELHEIPLEKLKEVLNISSDEELLKELKKRFNKADAFDQIHGFLSIFKIPYRYSSY